MVTCKRTFAALLNQPYGNMILLMSLKKNRPMAPAKEKAPTYPSGLLTCFLGLLRGSNMLK